MRDVLRTALKRLAGQPAEEQERIATLVMRELGDAGASEDSPEEKLDGTIGLFLLGLDMMEQQLRRDFPNASDEEVERRLQKWLETDDMAGQLPPGTRLAPERLKKLVGESG